MSALLQANQATLLIVDMQGRLMPAIHDGQAVLAAAHKLAQAARLLDVPVVATEHHARMLGVTVAPLDTQIQARFPKMHFSATREPGFTAWLPPARASRPITMRPCAARGAGAEIVTTEMAIFEWMETCEHPKFRDVLRLVK